MEVPGAELGIDSDGFFEMGNLPKKAVIVGSGYIAVEIAGTPHSLISNSLIYFMCLKITNH